MYQKMAAHFDRKTAFIANLCYGIVVLLCMLGIFLQYNFSTCIIDGESMTPTLIDKHSVVVSVYFKPIKVNTVVIFDTDNILTSNPNEPLIKRVVATGGQTIKFRRDVKTEIVYLQRADASGVFQDIDEPYINNQTMHFRSDTFGYYLPSDPETVLSLYDQMRLNPDHTATVAVPDGHVFCMGDNRDHSTDSRFIGTVPLSDVRSVMALSGAAGEFYEKLKFFALFMFFFLGGCALFFTDYGSDEALAGSDKN